MTPPILNLCARIEPHPLQQRYLAAACQGVRQWESLLPLAEKHGLAPLLYRHLSPIEEAIPETFIRGLRFLSIRHQRENELRQQCLQYVLATLETEGIPSLVLKGAALGLTLYPKIGLRPMCDIDLFLAKEDVQHAHALLQKKGFLVSTEALPKDYYHLPPLCQNIGGFAVWLELHHGLFPDLPPYYEALSFAASYENAQAFKLGDGTGACTLANEEMLWHLYQHGFRAPLTYNCCKLIAVADMVSLVEDRMDDLDWNKLLLNYPQVVNALSLFHSITPWSDKALEKIPVRKKAIPGRVGESFQGWPRVLSRTERREGLVASVSHTLFPSRWWLLVYYGGGEQLFSLLWCRLVCHPLHLLRWLKIYAIMFLKGNQ